MRRQLQWRAEEGRLRSSSGMRWVGVCGTAAVVATALMTPVAASAAPADIPFDSDNATVFIGYGDPTQLATTVINEDGDGFDLQPVGSAAPGALNALGYNTTDDFLYATQARGNVAYRIDATGAVEDLGPVPGLPDNQYNQGTFGLGDDEGIWFVRDLNHVNRIWAIDLTQSPAVTSEIVLDAPTPNVSDIVYRDGYIWGVLGNGTQTIYRIALDLDNLTGHVDSFDASSLGLVNQPYGGQWLYGNGNLGVTGNTDGTVYQIAIENADSANPTFSVASSAKGQPTTNNDAASILGLPADLSIAKSGDATVTAGDDYTYTITVTNEGEGASTGSHVSDALPAGLLDPSTATPGCDIAAGVLDCFVGPLAKGESATIEVSGSTADDVTTDSLVNTASVAGNEADPDPSNNEATFGPEIFVPAPAIALEKSADLDVATAAGQVITYSFTVTNTGNVDVRDVAVDEGDFSGHGSLGDVICPADAALLVPDASVTCEAEYTVVAEDLTGEEITNTASASATGPTGPIASEPAEFAVPTVAPAPAIALEKSADLDVATAAGQVITYSFTVTNTGNVDVRDVAVDEGDFSGHGSLGDVICPADAALLVPDASVTCEAEYTVVAEDLTGEEITNTASASATGPTGPVDSDEATATVKTVAAPAPAPAPGLATTGGDIPLAAGVTAILMLLGGAVLLISRRRTV